MSKNILITGGAGYIGSAIADRLVKSGLKVVVFDDLSSGQATHVPAEANLIVGDVTDNTTVQDLFTAHHFDAVIHCAGKKSVREGEENPFLYYHTNVLGTLNILHAMEAHNVPHIIFSSTAAVYKPSEKRSFKETDEVEPISVYGQSKLMCEQLITSFAKTKKITTYQILRYFNVAGDAGLGFMEDGAENVFPLLAQALLNQEPFYIFGTDYNTPDGTAIRDYIHLHDLVTAHLRCLELETSGVFNLGTASGYSVKQLTSKFSELSGLQLQIENTTRRPGDAASVLADVSKAHTVLQWKANSTLDEMVKDTLATFINSKQ